MVAAGDSIFVDFEESVRSPKVLQGQENTGFGSLFYERDTLTNRPDFELGTQNHQNLASTGARQATTHHELMSVHPSTYAGFAEINRFPKVLQGQEICPSTRKVDINLGVWGKNNVSLSTYYMNQATKPNFNLLGPQVLQTAYFPYNGIHNGGQGSMLCPNFHRENVLPNMNSSQAGIMIMRNEIGQPVVPNEQKLQDNISAASLGVNMMIPNDENFKGKVNGCKLFGFTLSEETIAQNLHDNGRSSTKVSDDSNRVML